MRTCIKPYVKHLNCKLYYQQLHLKYLCNLARYWLEAPWGWHDSVETCRIEIICEIVVHLLVIVQNNKRCTVQRIEIKIKYKKFTITFLNLKVISFLHWTIFQLGLIAMSIILLTLWKAGKGIFRWRICRFFTAAIQVNAGGCRAWRVSFIIYISFKLQVT